MVGYFVNSNFMTERNFQTLISHAGRGAPLGVGFRSYSAIIIVSGGERDKIGVSKDSSSHAILDGYYWVVDVDPWSDRFNCRD